jgi:transposase
MIPFKYFVGADMASSTFTVSVGTLPWKVVLKPQEFENTEDGFQMWLAWLTQHQILAEESVVCMEATGVYGEGLAYFAHAKGYRVTVQPPLEVKRAFKPNIRKTDAVDSLQIAEYAARYADRLSLWQPRNEVLEQIKVLLTTREQCVAQNTAHQNNLKAIQRKPVKIPFAEQTHLEMIEFFHKQIHAIDSEIRRLIESDPTFKQMLCLLLSVPGVGLLLAAYMILLTQVSLNYKQLNSFLGIAPNEHSSGSSVHGQPTSRHFGATAIRKLLYLAALSVRTHRAQFRTYFLRKTQAGKPPRVVLNNIENKLVKIICAVLRSNSPYNPNYSPALPLILKDTLTGS